MCKKDIPCIKDTRSSNVIIAYMSLRWSRGFVANVSRKHLSKFEIVIQILVSNQKI